MRQGSAERDTRTNYDKRRSHYDRQRRRCCGTGRACRAREDPPEEGCQPEEGRVQRPQNRQGGKSDEEPRDGTGSGVTRESLDGPRNGAGLAEKTASIVVPLGDLPLAARCSGVSNP